MALFITASRVVDAVSRRWLQPLTANASFMRNSSRLGMFMALGAAIGVALGAATHHVGEGLALGTAFGVAIGAMMGRRTG